MFSRKTFRVCAIAFAGVCVSQTAALAQCGTASWYKMGKQTANGERYYPDGISAAHRTLPFGTKVLVRNQRTGRTVTVRINDRGPFIGGRIIDLSRGAKNVIGMDGLASVCLTVLGRGERVAGAKAKQGKSKRVAAISKAKPKRVAAAKQGRNTRVARADRRRTRTVYGTTQTSARYDANTGRSARRNRSANRAQPRAQRQYRQARQQRGQRSSGFAIAGWPATGNRF